MEGNNIPPKCIFCDNRGIYRCPCCLRLTCSLKCCQEHKNKYNCTGKRDRTSFVSLKDYSDNSLRRDYHFLEDVVQSKQSSRRGLLRNGILNENQEKALRNNNNNNNNNNKTQFREDAIIGKHSRSTKKLISEAKNRGIDLILMSPGMSKRTHNSTKIIKNKIQWQIQFVFLKLSDVEFSRISTIDHYVNNTSYLAFITKAIPEDMTLTDILIAWRKEQPNEENEHTKEKEEKEKVTELNTESMRKASIGTRNTSLICMPHQCKQEAQTLLQHSDDSGDVQCYLPIAIKEGLSSFLLLDQTSTITDICKQQRIIEYPTIYVGRDHQMGHASVKNSITILEEKEEAAPPIESAYSSTLISSIEKNYNEDKDEIGSETNMVETEEVLRKDEEDEDDEDEHANDFLEALQDLAGQESDILKQMLHP